MPYVLRRDQDGAFVAPDGRRASYTFVLQDARIFSTLREADENRCGNECVVDVNNILVPSRG